MNKLTIVLFTLILMGCNKIEERKAIYYQDVSVRVYELYSGEKISSFMVYKNGIQLIEHSNYPVGKGFEFKLKSSIKSNDKITVYVDQFESNGGFIVSLMADSMFLYTETSQRTEQEIGQKAHFEYTVEEGRLFQ
ncbi:MAG: hypothetical protein ACPG5O_04100 [Pseudoalteromonas tetraodonis]